MMALVIKALLVLGGVASIGVGGFMLPMRITNAPGPATWLLRIMLALTAASGCFLVIFGLFATVTWSPALP